MIAAHLRRRERAGRKQRLRLVTPFCAWVMLVAAAAAGETDAPSPSLSPGGAFSEKGGEAIYAGVCAACHQPDAKGSAGAGAYPALAGNGKLASADYLLQVLLRGLGGMPPVGGMMSDQQIADVANYVRSHFGNAYRDTVTAAAVKAARPPGPPDP
jgi:mono/diheme cytochrome c family protein